MVNRLHVEGAPAEPEEIPRTKWSSNGGHHRPIRAVVAAVVVLLTVGCSGVRGELVESGYVPDEAGNVELTFADEADGDKALFAFSASELYTGTTIEGSELHRNAPLVITFVVPSCAVCIVEAPKLALAAEAHPEVNFVVIHSFGDMGSFLEYTDYADLSQENTVHLVDMDGTLWDRFGVISQPSTVLVDGSGRVTSSRGALGDDGLLRAIATVSNL